MADINIGTADVVNNLTTVGTDVTPNAHIVPAKILWLLLIFVTPNVCRATILVTNCSADRVVVGADGLSLHPEDTQHPTFKSCKIVQSGNDCFFAISGLQNYKAINYDLVPLARRACRGPGSVIERANTFKKVALPEIQRAWINTRKNNPRTYALLKRYGPARLSVVFAEGPPFTVIIVQFVEDSNGKMMPENSIVDACNFASHSVFRALGERQNVEAYQRQHPEIENLDDVAFVRSLLLGAIELEGFPKVIGPPVAILEITSSGARWIEQGACAEIKHRSQANSHKQP